MNQKDIESIIEDIQAMNAANAKGLLELTRRTEHVPLVLWKACLGGFAAGVLTMAAILWYFRLL